MIIDLDKKLKQTIDTIKPPYLVQDVFNTFIKLFPEDWKKHKIAYSKFSRSKQFGKTIPLPKPEVSLKKDIGIWLKKQYEKNNSI